MARECIPKWPSHLSPLPFIVPDNCCLGYSCVDKGVPYMGNHTILIIMLQLYDFTALVQQCVNEVVLHLLAR